MTKVKICGITDEDVAISCIENGVDFLGFNFVKNSKRYCQIENAEKIIKMLNHINRDRKVKYVGVFQNENCEKVNKIANLLNLDFIQLHGEENNTYIDQMNCKIIKKLVIPSNDGIQKIQIELQYKNKKYYLLDRYEQGKGAMVDTTLAKIISQKTKLFFAGGLTPENVASIVKEVKPFAVDVAGGVETNEKKDKQKIKQFIQNAKLGGSI
jgi:phosphoribosylanthranilate isomerase